MIVKFSDGTVCRVDEGINNVELINRFKSLHYISNKTKLLTNDYRELLPINRSGASLSVLIPNTEGSTKHYRRLNSWTLPHI